MFVLRGNSDRAGEGCVVDIPGGAARANARGAAHRIHSHPFHHRQVDDQAIVDTPQSWTVVAATTNGDEQAVVAAEIDFSPDSEPNPNPNPNPNPDDGGALQGNNGWGNQGEGENPGSDEGKQASSKDADDDGKGDR